MKKFYYDFIKEISADELYDGLLGYVGKTNAQ